MRIILVEDEHEFGRTLCGALEREHYIVDWMKNGTLALEASKRGVHDLVLLDRTLPDGDGIELVSQIRRNNPGIPIIVLSARGELSDRIDGLDEGADDYLVKPFEFNEMLARIRAVRRRPNELAANEILLGNLVFDVSGQEALVGGNRLNLQRREARVLTALLHRRGRTVLRESLEEAVYGFDDMIQSNSLDSHVSRLRRKLNDAGGDVEIHTIRGVGYLLKTKG